MTRSEELAAIAERIATKGVTRCPPAFANAESSFIALFRNRERAGVKHEPSDTAAMRRDVRRPANSIAAANAFRERIASYAS